MARKIELGLKGYFIPQFFDRKYIKQENSPGSNSWLICRRIHTFPLKDYNLYKSVVKVIYDKENKLSKMKVALPIIKQMNERQRRKESPKRKKTFPIIIQRRNFRSNQKRVKVISNKSCS